MFWIRTSFWRVLRWFLFCLDAETAHLFSIRLIRLGIRFKHVPLHMMSGVSYEREKEDFPEVFGIRFHSRLGLAAGFDKNAEILAGCPSLGFGFVEIGTVTPRPQHGNTLPRLFRDTSHQSLFNRMGFNSLGAEAVAKNVFQARSKLPRWAEQNFRVGINLGKNKETSLEDAASDYKTAASFFEGLADYLVINVSSPNTPDLRSLQTVETLKPIVASVLESISGWKKSPPLLVKIAPEVTDLSLKSLIQALEPYGVEGWVLTNTLAGTYCPPRNVFGHMGAPNVPKTFSEEILSGGWSGGVLAKKSLQSLLEARSMSRKPIISVGGIMSAEEATARISAGASLIQIYTGWIYGGPTFPLSLKL